MYLTCNSKPLTDKVHEGEPYGDYITETYKRDGTVLYWRKANAIHKWFVDNVQNGDDDCGDYEVYWEQLMELKGICKRIVEECPLIDGKVRTGDSWNGTEWVNIGYEPTTPPDPDEGGSEGGGDDPTDPENPGTDDPTDPENPSDDGGGENEGGNDGGSGDNPGTDEENPGGETPEEGGS